MTRRHWLDPLARRLLVATGQLPPPAGSSGAAAPADAIAPAHDEAVEQELLALRLAQNPGRRLRDAGEVRQAAALGWRLDVNRATAADWLRLPGISADQVDQLLKLQRAGVQLSGPDDLQQLLQPGSGELEQWLPLLDFRWYDGAPQAAAAQLPDLNRAGAQELASRLPLLEEGRRQRLLRERQRQPFANLADLQERLQLPPSLVEQLIGRVRFGPAGPASGPDLPRPTPRQGRS
jgi:DNA uptake protein ComE-like DNA-binding protein